MIRGRIITKDTISGNVKSDKLFDHSLLHNRNEKGAHTISAIDGLEDELKALKNVDKAILDTTTSNTRNILIEMSETKEELLKADAKMAAGLDALYDRVDDSVSNINNKISNLDNKLDTKISELTESTNALAEATEGLNDEFEVVKSDIKNNLKDARVYIDSAIYKIRSELNTTEIALNSRLHTLTNLQKLFKSKTAAQVAVNNNKNLYKEGHIVTVSSDNKGFTIYVVDSNRELKQVGASGGGSTPATSIPEQFCIQYDQSDYTPELQKDGDKIVISNKPDGIVQLKLSSSTARKNTVTTSATGGYVYYISTLDNLTFTVGGFSGGFTKQADQIDNPAGNNKYYVYKSNQKLTFIVDISIT